MQCHALTYSASGQSLHLLSVIRLLHSVTAIMVD